ncbi:MAG TPA: quinolinate synthase NadA [Dehalococcoidia bacterium]|nr:quinolinate synthase NadA [Dehalococcoidia bacterium]
MVRPETELAELRDKILSLKRGLNAIIVAHNYQLPEVQDIADFVGDSLELARKSAQVEADVIVFCGVHFMAETAAILNPARTVLLAEATAGCPMADMIDVPELRRWKERYPEAGMVCYVNSSAAVKAESDICCTSANAVQVVESLPNEEILFIPDQNLGHYVSTQTQKRVIPYPGYCITHHRVRPEQVRRAKELHPEAAVVVHPECIPEVVAMADAVCSTSQMLRYVRESPARTFLIGTEFGLLHRMRKENPDKTFYAVSTALVCPNMKKTRLESVLTAMEERRNIIRVPEEVRVKAQQALDGMLAVSKVGKID